jgi:hypothetical protein
MAGEQHGMCELALRAAFDPSVVNTTFHIMYKTETFAKLTHAIVFQSGA